MIDDSELRDLDPFDIMDAEARRLDGFFAGLHDDDWLRPTRCAGWRRRELLAHLLFSEQYNHATLDDSLQALFQRAQEAGVSGMDAFNDWGVRVLADRGVDDMLAEWRQANGQTRTRLRERGWDASISTMVGPYPAGLQAFHLAMELAVHADDMGVPVADGERRLRGGWQARFTVREYDRPVEIHPESGMNRVSAEGMEASIDDEELVNACAARLPADDPIPQGLRDLLRVFA